ncbi:MAG: hypothetical protein PHQ04_04700 [Opitutaceae bacterium]|nr:hypothetical protein [Opitutaceae bacterium]
MRCCQSALLLLFALASGMRAELAPISASEIANPPSRERVTSLVARAARQGWGVGVEELRAAALAAYEANNGQAQAWYYLYRWASLLSLPERKAGEFWIAAVNRARVGHANMPQKLSPSPGSLSALWTPALQLHALGSFQFSEEFFATVASVDNPMMVLSILQSLYAADPNRFADYQNLALAIAVVYDVPPPPDWPHGQVSEQALPRLLPRPEEAFSFWVRSDREGRTLHRLRRLSANELKFVVDAGARLQELTWAQRKIPNQLADFARVYDLVPYRKDRLQAGQANWPRSRYELPLILKEGGICVDQAYFASMAGKAKGVPTLLFRGAGLDGRHAWFGYLDSAQKWQLDCGRYAEQKYVAGLAFDPQTWGNISDHELVFLSERFRLLPLYRLSMVHAAFAEEYLNDRNAAAALNAAREAVNREQRNVRAWEVLLRAQTTAGQDARTIEGTLREAALAFRRYPDLEVGFVRRLVESLRARGESSLADYEEKRMVLKNKRDTGRPDLAYEQASEMLRRSMEQDDLPTQIRNYNSVVDKFGAGAGMDFYDKIVLPFVQHLRDRGELPAAIQSVQRARRALKAGDKSQLDGEIERLLSELKKGV